MLWCLLRSLQLRIDSPISASDGTPGLLVLEPKNGGGDVRVISAVTEIDQLKSKSDLGTWSLQSIISNVLPDLYLAVDDRDCDSTRFRLVTEGRIGDWKEVYSFFQQFSDRTFLSEYLDCFDETKIVPFAFRKPDNYKLKKDKDTEQPFFPKSKYSERDLFLLIEEKLLLEPRIQKLRLSVNTFRTRLWKLLGNFDIVENQTVASLQSQVDKRLGDLLDVKDELPRVRGQMIVSLIALSAKGNCHVSVEALFAECGLGATPLSKRCELKRNCAIELESILKSRKYNREDDVRFESNRRIANDWMKSNAVLLITGDSGQGKSWTMASIATIASEGKAPVLWIDATGNAKTDLQAAADQFWLDARGGQHQIPFRQMVTQINQIESNTEPYTVRLCIDNAKNFDEVIAIVRENWSARKVGIAITCPKDIAESVVQDYPKCVMRHTVDDFSWSDLHRFLDRLDGDVIAAMPDDVKNTLRRPLLASIYRNELDHDWKPTSEYELYSRAWNRVSTRSQSSFPLDASKVATLSLRVLDGEPYPWTSSFFRNPQDNELLQRLERCGWFTRSQDRWHIFHDRLLNWSVAQALYEMVRSKQSSVDEVFNRISAHESNNPNVFLGYVAMDFLWLASGDSSISEVYIARFLELHEQNFIHRPEDLYGTHVRTLGQRIVPALLKRFREYSEYPPALTVIGESIAFLLGDVTKSEIEKLLRSAEPLMQRRGFILLSAAPTAHFEKCDLVWEIYKKARQEPQLYSFQSERSPDFIRNQMWKALAHSVKSNPDWLIGAIEDCALNAELLNDLLWILLECEDGKRVWLRCKSMLFERSAVEHVRTFAICIRRFRDDTCKDWLREKLSKLDESTAIEVFRALVRLESDRGKIPFLAIASDCLRYFSHQAFSEYWLRDLNCVNATIDRWMAAVDNPFHLAATFQGFLNEIPVRLYDKLLDRFELSLIESSRADTLAVKGLITELAILDEIVAPKFRAVLVQRRGTAFEEHLVTWVRRLGPRIGRWGNEPDRDHAIQLLRRLNADRLASVVAEFMSNDDEFAKRHAICLAMQAPNAEATNIATKWVMESREVSGKPRDSQRHALELLLLNRRFREVANGICHLGLNSIDLGTARQFIGENSNCDWVDELRTRVLDSPTDGNIAALGLFGSRADIPTLQATLRKCVGETNLVRACLVGLLLQNDRSDIGIDLAIKNFEIEPHWSQSLLVNSRSQKAWTYLYEKLAESFDCVLALKLANHSEYAKEVIELAKREVLDEVRYTGWQDLYFLLSNLKPELREELLSDQSLRDFLIQNSFIEDGSVLYGNKIDLIRSLAYIDREAAYRAARKLFFNVETSDRKTYPSLLLELEPDTSPEMLIDQLVVESDQEVWFAIGRALESIPITDLIDSKLRSLNPNTRKAACFVAGWSTDDFQAQIRNCFEDENDDVVLAAVNAMRRKSRRSIAMELAEEISKTTEPSEWWCLIDDLIGIMDPGDSRAAVPKILESLIQDSPKILRRIVLKQLNLRQQKLEGDLKR